MKLMKRQLGQTDLKVSPVGLGTVKLGRNQEVKYPVSFSLPQDNEVADLLAMAKELGINLIDTAPAYGSSEQRLGRLLRDREDWVICTKVGEEFTGGQSYFDFSGQHINDSVERSLRYIQTDYLDIVLIHSDGSDEQIIRSSDCIETLTRLKEKGLIRAIGMSSKTLTGGLLAVDCTDVVMVTYNPSNTGDADVIEKASLENKGVLVKKALNSGHDCYSGDRNIDAVAHNLNFVYSNQGVDSVIIGTINSEHLVQNVKAAITAIEHTR
ncbi:MAG: aldo/keto reductase [Gammaproteobacteria bacterium]|jgi:aryl-alcohol dehydrogenase-like predicted oxidoreductase|nr:aldo/keto reductase [Gammaproteobacteria bacterium]MDP6097429.1 aldo/keto reductase [Gammaproteobacteria bacterium]MDP7455322.1 aldo/keto reductase [Gammaproteobacteria bacterium]